MDHKTIRHGDMAGLTLCNGFQITHFAISGKCFQFFSPDLASG